MKQKKKRATVGFVELLLDAFDLKGIIYAVIDRLSEQHETREPRKFQPSCYEFFLLCDSTQLWGSFVICASSTLKIAKALIKIPLYLNFQRLMPDNSLVPFYRGHRLSSPKQHISHESHTGCPSIKGQNKNPFFCIWLLK